MFRLSNLVTALFGVIAALGTILGISSLGNASKIVKQPGEQLTQEQEPSIAETLSNGIAGLNSQDNIAQSGARQVGQNATNSADEATPAAADSAAKTTSQNPSADFFVQGEGAVLDAEPAPPSTPTEATAVQLDPSPGVVPPTAPATVPTQAPVAQAPEATERTPAPAPAPAPVPVRAMW